VRIVVAATGDYKNNHGAFVFEIGEIDYGFEFGGSIGMDFLRSKGDQGPLQRGGAVWVVADGGGILHP